MKTSYFKIIEEIELQKKYVNKHVRRKGNDRVCLITDMKKDTVKIVDDGFWTGWVSLKMFEEKWEFA